MENQSELMNNGSDQVDQRSADGLDQTLWARFPEELDLGLFYFSRQENTLYYNEILGDWLATQADFRLDEKRFWEHVSALAMDPVAVSEEVGEILKDISEHPLIQFPLLSSQEITATIQFFPLAGSKTQQADYGGYISKGRQSKQYPKDFVKIFDQLLAPARQLAAAVQGNLQALEGNLGVWSPEVLNRFLADARSDLSRTSKYLDLGLIYSKVIRHSSIFRFAVPVIDLLEEIIEELGYSTMNIHLSQLERDQPVRVKIDRDMVKIALEILLKELIEQSPDGQQFELRVSEQDGFILLNVDSPRILPLPGLGADDERRSPIEINPEIYLASEILAAQGGDLLIERRPIDGGGGLDIEVSLPIAALSPKRHSGQDWGEMLERGSGRILLAEAQPEYQLPVRDALTDLGYRVDLAVDGSTVLDMIQTGQPRLVILARNLPGMDGLLVTQGVRRWSSVPIIMISMRDNSDDLLYAYRLGVDDYLIKPFLIEELLAKIQVLLRRGEDARRSSVSEIYQEGSIRIDQGSRQVWVRGNLVQLTPIEYNLLVYLSRQGKQIIPYEQLLEHVWEGPEKGTRQGLFVHVRRLREKIELDPKNPRILNNKWGVGYVFNP